MGDATLDFILRLKDELTAGLERAKKQLEASGKSYTKTFEDAQASSEQFAAGIAVAGAAIVSFGAYAVKQAMDAESAQNRLNLLLKNATGATDEQVQSLFNQAKALSHVGVVSEGNIQIAQGQLATFDLQAESIERLIPSILDYAVAEKGASVSADELQQMTNGLAQALNGNYASLTASGFVLDENTKKIIKNGTEAQKVSAIVAVLSSTYEGFNEAATRTAEGSLVALWNKINDIAGAIGSLLLPMVKDALDSMNTAASGVLAWVESLGSVENVIAMVGEKVKEFRVILAAIAGALAPAFLGAAAAIAVAAAHLAPFILLAISLQMAIEVLHNAWMTNWGGMRDIILGFIATVQPIISTLVTLFQQWQPYIMGIVLAFGSWHALMIIFTPILATTLTSITAMTAGFLAMNPVLLIIIATLALMVGSFIAMQMEMTRLNGLLDQNIAKFQGMDLSAQNLRTTLGGMNSDFVGLATAQSGYAQAMETVSEKQRELLELGKQGLALSHEKVMAVQAELDAAQASADSYQAMFREQMKGSEIAARSLIANSQEVYEAQVRLGEDELRERLSLWQEEVRGHERATRQKMDNNEITHEQFVDMMEQQVYASNESLSQILAAEGDVTQQKIELLRQYGLAFSQVGQAVVTMDESQLNNRLQMASQFHLQNSGLLKAFVNYTAKASDAELQVYGQKLEAEQSASNEFREQIRKLFSTPIVQSVSVQGTFFDKMSGTVAQITGGINNFVNSAVSAVGGYVKKVGAINAEFDATVTQIRAAETAGADALNNLGGGGGGKGKGGGGGGGGGKGNPALDKIKKQAEEVAEAFEKMEEKYDETKVKIGDITTKMNEDHESKMLKFRDEIRKSRDEIGKLSDDYDKFVQGQGNEFGNAFVKAESEMGRLYDEMNSKQQEAQKLRLTGGSAEDISGTETEVAMLQAKINEQQSILDKANQYIVVSKDETLAQIATLENNYNEQKRIYDESQDIMERARAQATMEELKSSIEYKKIIEQNLAAEQQNLANGVARARKTANQSDLENFLDGMELKRVTEAEAHKAKIQAAKDKIAAVREEIVTEVDANTAKMKAVKDIQDIMEENHKTMMQRQTSLMKDEINKQIEMYNKLATAASNAAQGKFTSPATYKSDGGVVYKADGGMVGAFMPRGTDTIPAMLTPGEIVVNAMQQRNLAANLTRGQGGGNTYILNVDRFIGEEAWAEQAMDKFVRKLQYATTI